MKLSTTSIAPWKAKVAGILLATFAVLGVARGQQPTIKWVMDPSIPSGGYVELHGFTIAPDTAWQSVFPVYAGPIASRDLPPMLGSYRVESGVVRFIPQFPLQKGMSYHAVVTFDKKPPIASASIDIPADNLGPSTVVQQVYPSAEVVPENLLKFYVEFSGPMSRGDVYDHVQLLDTDGSPVDLPFLRLNEELWDSKLQRLTLLFDPGRIKRGVQPQEQIGPALLEGRRYTLVIARDMKDAAGQLLKEPFQKHFTVGPADRTAIDPLTWKLTPPPAGTAQPLRVEFGEPLDRALALRMIGIADQAGKSVDGDVSLDQTERRWTFTPAQSWPAAPYRLVIRTTIEDLAGNNVGKAFDVDVSQNDPRQVGSATVEVPFSVR